MLVLTRRIRLLLHGCTCGCFQYVCTAAGHMSANFQAAARSLWRVLLWRQHNLARPLLLILGGPRHT